MLGLSDESPEVREAAQGELEGVGNAWVAVDRDDDEATPAAGEATSGEKDFP